MTYRTGNHWGVTIVREGDDVVHLIRDGDATTQCCGKTPFELPRAQGHRLAVEPDRATCPRRVDDQLVAVVVNGDQALAERICALLNDDADEVKPDIRVTRTTYLQPLADGECTHGRVVRYNLAIGFIQHIFDDSTCTGEVVTSPSPADSCTCTVVGPDPACPVHHGRRARGPKPPPVGDGCICDGSGRTCPRHGAVL